MVDFNLSATACCQVTLFVFLSLFLCQAMSEHEQKAYGGVGSDTGTISESKTGEGMQRKGSFR